MTRLRLTLVSLLTLATLGAGLLPASPAAANLGEVAPDDTRHLSQERLDSLPFTARGLEGLAPEELRAFAASYDVGSVRHFPALDDAVGVFLFKPFTLRAAGTHGEIWVSTDLQFPVGDCRGGVNVTQEQIDYLLGEFDRNIYPAELAYFGPAKERSGAGATLPELYDLPDDYYAGSSRTIILVDNIRDENFYDYPANPGYIGGFFSSGFARVLDRNVITIDSYDWAHRTGPTPPHQPTNDPCTSRPARPLLYEGTLAHEYQHLIHNDYDPAEQLWVNEGMADFAEFLTRYSIPRRLQEEIGADSHIQAFLGHGTQPVIRDGRPVQVITAGAENSLPRWGDQGNAEILADYGAAYAFMLYVNEKFGGAPFMRYWQNSPLQGIAGFEDALAKFGYQTTFAQVYHDFAVAVAIDRQIDDGSVGAVPYDKYQIHDLRAQVNVDTEQAYSAPGAPPWGSDYVRIGTPSELSALAFDGADNVVRRSLWTSRSAGPANWGGGAVLWSGHRNNGDAFLVRRLTLGAGAQTLSFDTYYDIEQCYDYGVVQVSTDNGRTFRSLGNADTSSCQPPPGAEGGPQDPRVTANLPGFTGQTPAWKRTTFDLSAFAGQAIILSFRYITDPAAGGNDATPDNDGWWIDNVTLNDAVLSDGSSLDGWGDITAVLPIPAAFTVQVLAVRSGRFTVTQLPVAGEGKTGALTAAQLADLAAYDYLVAIVTYDAPTDSRRIVTVPDYAPYALTVTRNGVATTLPGGGR